MSTPYELIEKYKENICIKCDQTGECSIRIIKTNNTVTAKCTDFKQLDICMRNKCDSCKDNLKCFGSDFYE